MPRYLISFPPGAMEHIAEEDIPEVGEAAHAVVQEAMDAGILVFAGGLDEAVEPVSVAGDGSTAPASAAHPLAGMMIVDVPSHEAALGWAARIAAACRCPQEVNVFMPDPAVGN